MQNFTLAQTQLQLYGQLQRLGWARQDIVRLADAYRFATILFSSQFRASGVPFLHHLVRTASIVADIDAAPAPVIAALLHAAYTHGDFGSNRWGITSRKQAELRAVVGPETDELIRLYSRFSLAGQAQQAKAQTQTDKKQSAVLLIALANELEEHLDWGKVYSHKNTRHENTIQSLHDYAGIAGEYGYAGLEQAFRQLIEQYRDCAGHKFARLLAEQPVPHYAIHYGGRDSSYRLRARSTRLSLQTAARVWLRRHEKLRSWLKKLPRVRETSIKGPDL